jgi:hypothetical protein
METIGTGAGLAALGFWTFIAAAVAATYWDKIRKREAEHETLRRIIESGQPIDDELTDKLLSVTGGSRELARDLKVSGLIVLFIAPGLALLGWTLSKALDEPELWQILLGVAGLVGLLSIGLLVAAWVAERQYGASAEQRP